MSEPTHDAVRSASFQDQLVITGWRMFHDGVAADRLGLDHRGSYSKSFDDEIGTRYILIITHSVISSPPAPSQLEFFEPDAQFNKGGTTFNVKMLRHHESVEQVEAFFERMWTTLRLDYYASRHAQCRMPQPDV